MIRSDFISLILEDYCEGYFGRDGCGPKVIEGIGRDWIVVRYIEDKFCAIATFKNEQELEQKLNQWIDNDQ
ncbi:unnamed protein product [marine sediment metagenome]|uniref:Uncharacterized protein n=1 Tax=marine sediment metagenome TaxID=412755 RepID=X0UKD2_9ZZZZ